MIFYGMDDCSNCREAKARLKELGLTYEFRPIGEKVVWMKEFLAMRDHMALFDEMKKDGRIGIPCFVLPSGKVTLSLDEALQEAEM